VTEAVPPDKVRASDIDRKAVQDRLHTAHAEGLITLAEFDIRVGEAWQAVTRGDLAKVTADLPAPRPTPPPPPPPVPVRRHAPVALRVLATIWLSAAVVNIVVWGLVCLTAGHLIYPWWLWVAVPPGAVLGAVWWMWGGGKPDTGRALPSAE
jgi:hypothetical protein